MGINIGIDPQTMNEVVNAARSKFKQNFKETQGIRSFTLRNQFLKNAIWETPEHAFEWTLRIKSAQGSTQVVDAFEELNYGRDTYDVQMKVKPRTMASHTQMVFDSLVGAINKGAVNKIYKEYAMKGSACEEECAQTFESKILNAPYSVNAKDGFLGLLYWYRRSMTSGGVFTEQLTPARNGVYYRDGSGALASDMATISDTSAAAYGRARTLVATHRGVMNDSLATTIRDSVLDAGFEYHDDLMGEKTSVDLMIFWDDVFHRQYSDLVKALGGARRNDYFDVGDNTIKGVKVMPVPYMNGHFLRPIFGVNLSELKMRKEQGLFDVQYSRDLTHRARAYPIEYSWQIWAENPQAHGFLVHGSFATGT